MHIQVQDSRVHFDRANSAYQAGLCLTLVLVSFHSGSWLVREGKLLSGVLAAAGARKVKAWWQRPIFLPSYVTANYRKYEARLQKKLLSVSDCVVCAR